MQRGSGASVSAPRLPRARGGSRRTAPRPASQESVASSSSPFAGITQIRFGGSALGSALSAPQVGTPRDSHALTGYPARRDIPAGTDERLFAKAIARIE